MHGVSLCKSYSVIELDLIEVDCLGGVDKAISRDFRGLTLDPRRRVIQSRHHGPDGTRR